MATPSISPRVDRNLFIACLVIGVVALTLGAIASQSIGSEVSRLFSGWPSDRAIWLLLGGGITTVAGLIGLARGSR